MLRTRHLTYRKNGRALIEDISLEFHPGRLYGLLGPNGSGKSTLLKTLPAIWKPTSGTVLWQNQPLHQQSRETISQLLSLVPQTPSILFEFSVEAFVAMGRFPYVKAHGPNGTRQHVEQALEAVDATHLKNCLVSRLSHGERQRVYIARALVTEAPVLLLDEPTTSLDIGHQQGLWKLLQKLKTRGRIIVAALHDLSACSQHCDDLVLLHQGRAVAQGSPAAVLTPRRVQEVFGVTL